MRAKLEQRLRDLLPIPLSADEVSEILSAFQTSFDECAADLQGLADGTDFAAIRRVTHTIRGFAANVGADDLQSLALALNRAAHETDSAACSRLIQAILDLHAQYHAALTP